MPGQCPGKTPAKRQIKPAPSTHTNSLITNWKYIPVMPKGGERLNPRNRRNLHRSIHIKVVVHRTPYPWRNPENTLRTHGKLCLAVDIDFNFASEQNTGANLVGVCSKTIGAARGDDRRRERDVVRYLETALSEGHV